MNHEKAFLLGVIGVLSVVMWFMVEPFLNWILISAILAFILHPLQRRLKPYLGDRISAFFLIVFAILVAVIPVVFAAGAIVDDASDLSQDIQNTSVINTTKIEIYVQEYTGQSVDVETAVDSAIKQFTSITFGSFSKVFGLIVEMAIGLTLMLFLVYYFLKDGHKLILWLKDIAPIDSEVQEGIYERIDRTTWAVIKGHVFVAVAQGLIAGLGLYVSGVPNYIFWTFIMVLLGFIPIIGTIVVWAPAAIYLFLIDRPEAGIFLLIYGLIIVGFTDNILRPIVVDKQAELNPAAIIVGVLGGVIVFGAAGLFIGPILIGAFKAIVVALKNHYEDL